MPQRQRTISLALGLNDRYDRRAAIGIIKFARARPDLRLLGHAWLLESGGGRRADRPDGIIARITDRRSLARLLSYRVPVVDIANSYDEPRLPVVCNDDVGTGHMAGLHFLSKGFIRFAFIGIGEALWSRRRREGLWQAVREVQDELPEFNVPASWLRREYSLRGLSRWIARLIRPCAVLAVNDLMGYRAGMAARMAGIRVPDEMAIMGVDNEEVYCELSQPRLTSISCDCERIGTEAAGLLTQLLDGSDPLRRMVIPPMGIEARESTDIILGQDAMVREVKKFIRAQVGKGINVADVAAAFPLSRRALEKRFHQSEGKTLHDELIGVRLERAAFQLEAGNTVHSACFDSGFASLQHFYYAFKKRYGTTPARFAARKTAGTGTDDHDVRRH